MYLRELFSFQNIVIQCPDNPSVDSIAAGFALYSFFKNNNKQVKLVYSGKEKISRINIETMLNVLNIPLEYVSVGYICRELLITVNCQYEAKSLSRLLAPHVAIIDYHVLDEASKSFAEFNFSRLGYGCGSSLVYQLLVEDSSVENNFKNFLDLKLDGNVATALYYGVFIATNEFQEIKHPSDIDIRDNLNCDKEIFMELQNSAISLEELRKMSTALLDYKCYQEQRLAIVPTENCDHSIMSFIAEMVSRVCGIDTCVVFSQPLNGQINIVIKNCSPKVKANELVRTYVALIGTGFGNKNKSSGSLNVQKYRMQGNVKPFIDYFYDKFVEFYENCEYIRASDIDFARDKDSFNLCRKKSFVLGYVPTLNIAAEGTVFTVRTCEGDVKIGASPDIYIMVGFNGEIYPIEKDKFELTYRDTLDDLDIEYNYEPRVVSILTGQKFFLRALIKHCRVITRLPVFVKTLTKPTRVVSKWNYEDYMLGMPGDVLVMRSEDHSDIYVVQREIFNVTYEPMPSTKGFGA